MSLLAVKNMKELPGCTNTVEQSAGLCHNQQHIPYTSFTRLLLIQQSSTCSVSTYHLTAAAAAAACAETAAIALKWRQYSLPA
jgi:hypothetical protein